MWYRSSNKYRLHITLLLQVHTNNNNIIPQFISAALELEVIELLQKSNRGLRIAMLNDTKKTAEAVFNSSSMLIIFYIYAGVLRY